MAPALLVAVWLRLPETRPAAHSEAANLPILRALVELLSHRAFVAVAAALASGYGMLLTWLSTSAFLLIGELGLTKPQASAIYALGSGAYLGGSLIGVRVSRSLSAMTILRIAGPLLLLGALRAGRGARRGLSSLGGHPRLRRPVLLRLGCSASRWRSPSPCALSPTWRGRLRPGLA